LRRDTPTEWQQATGASEYLLYVTVDELHALDEQMRNLVKPFVERIGNPKKRPRGAAPIEVLFFAYPRPPHRTH
jgi:hypothetical protein